MATLHIYVYHVNSFVQFMHVNYSIQFISNPYNRYYYIFQIYHTYIYISVCMYVYIYIHLYVSRPAEGVYITQPSLTSIYKYIKSIQTLYKQIDKQYITNI